MKQILLRRLTVFIVIAISTVQIACGQKKTKKATPIPLTIDGNFTIASTPKSKIFNFLLKQEMELVAKNLSTILISDSIKGELISKRIAWCSYKADTTFNGKVIKAAVSRKEPYEYNIKFNVGDNIFTYVIPNFKNSEGLIIMKNDHVNERLSSCAESESWTIRDIITGESILVGMK